MGVTDSKEYPFWGKSIVHNEILSTKFHNVRSSLFYNCDEMFITFTPTGIWTLTLMKVQLL
jgi:hypothetical protein